ncbi:uncharacterized protein Z519_12803 [Cladophialophora bantiana CBS 173.52]|uniref:Tf2-1-like SH3-like domain-containing protein n=1 Tax=Cladophialophora bantiana (strain ATCC 10958 / CBS 173.52 / CDC B-1940 / NIH 8579) TaxID=1442370 RepID=A0A0D2E907_CLAB1|nr:uncharacterized protein Z519_12803 [Cladophialophora bantiana CBS 173.52]KIW86591.1 hypothetical protein Z519_12803 [Cladophialophora bantiana CBS 173.52]
MSLFFTNYGFHLRLKEVIDESLNPRTKKRMVSYVNKKRIEESLLEKRNPVYLLRKNIKTKRPSAKLDYTKLGPFRIKDKLGDVIYRLELLKDIKIYNVFYKALLKLAPRNAKII